MVLSNQPSALPRHLAIVLDGHRRYAVSAGCTLEKAYELGTSAIDVLVRFCLKNGITHLTLHIFSPNDLERAPKDVFAFLEVIRKALPKNLATYKNMGVRIHGIGQTENLDYTLSMLAYPFHRELCDVLADAVWQTRLKDRLILTLGLNYSGRINIVRAINTLYSRGCYRAGGFEMSDLDRILSKFSMNDLSLLPIDSFILTGMEQGRALPDIFCWQLVSSMARVYTTPTLWPNFGSKELERIFADYSGAVAV